MSKRRLQYEPYFGDEETSFKREKLRTLYRNKFYDLFMNSFKFEGLTREQVEYFMRKMWKDGRIACFLHKQTDELVFTPFNIENYNVYDWPETIRLINNRQVSYIPDGVLEVNKEAIICYALKNQKAVSEMIDYYINKIVEAEMTLDLNLSAHRQPFIMRIKNGNGQKVKQLFNKIKNGDASLYLEADEDTLEVLKTDAPYIVDKIYNYIQGLINEALTFLGIDNLGSIEKKEHFIVDEVNANNDLINDSSNCFYSNFLDFTKLVKEIFNKDIKVEPTSAPIVSVKQEEENNEDDNTIQDN